MAEHSSPLDLMTEAGRQIEEKKKDNQERRPSKEHFGSNPAAKNKPINRPTRRHYDIVALYTDGYTYKQIADRMGCSTAKVSQVLNDPHFKSIIGEMREAQKMEARALTTDVVRKLGGMIHSPNPDVSLKAMEQLRKWLAYLEEKTDTGSGTQVNVNIAQDARERLASKLQDDPEIKKFYQKPAIDHE